MVNLQKLFDQPVTVSYFNMMSSTKRPLIGLTADMEESKDPLFSIKRRYVDAVADAGGTPIILPALTPARRNDPFLSIVDGLLVTGGYFDIDPRLYGEEPLFRIDDIKRERTESEIYLIKKAVRLGLPVFGVCGGLQAINVAFKGSLYQDLGAQLDNSLQHEQKPLPVAKASHPVDLSRGSTLAKTVKSTSLQVNSTHHQAIKKLGKGLNVCATAPDGVIEAIEGDDDGSFIMGVQWHPEQLADNSASAAMFKAFVRRCREYMRSR